MAAPAALLLVATGAAQILPGLRGGRAGEGRANVVVDGAAPDGGRKHGNIGSGEGTIVSVQHHHSHHDNDSGFDFYVYSMSYQPEFCRENDDKFDGCRAPEDDWKGQLTIHGLWPSRNDGTWPSACSDEKLDLSIVMSDGLSQNWPNIKALSPDAAGHTAFWDHEWSKHGTCSGLSQQDYFNTALDLLLSTPSIVKESYGSLAKREELEADPYLGGDMSMFVCKQGDFLSEVRVCYEKMADNAVGERVSCPGSMLTEDSCGEEIRIATFDSVFDSRENTAIG